MQYLLQNSPVYHLFQSTHCFKNFLFHILRQKIYSLILGKLQFQIKMILDIKMYLFEQRGSEEHDRIIHQNLISYKIKNSLH
jgi:hypothetical protein